MRENLKFTCFVALILLSSIAIQIPLYNRGLVFFDEGIIFNISESVLNGDVVFKDRPSFVLPGIFYLLALLYKIFDASTLVSRYAMAIVFSLTSILGFLISRRLMKDLPAFLTAMLFVTHRVWAFHIWNMIGYATFAIFFLAVALLLLLRFAEHPRPVTAFFVGLFVAIATMFKQDYGGFAGLGMFLYMFIWPNLRARIADAPEIAFSRIRAVGAYIIGGVAVCLPVFAYFALKGALGDLFQNTLFIPLMLETTRDATPLVPLLPLLKQDAYLRGALLEYAPGVVFLRLFHGLQTASPPGFLYRETSVWDILIKLIHFMPYFASIAGATLLVKHYVKNTLSIKHMKLAAVLIFTVSIVLTQHKPFDFAHLMQMYFPVFLLVGFLADASYSKIHQRKTLSHLTLIVGAAFLAAYLYYTVAGAAFIVRYYPAKLEGPRANIYMRQNDRDTCSQALRFINENTSPDESIFVLPYQSLFYFLAQRPNPTRFECLWPVKVFEDMDREIIATLDNKQINYIVEFPQPNRSIGSYKEFAPEIAGYVRNNYFTEKVFGHPYKGLYIRILKRKHNNRY